MQGLAGLICMVFSHICLSILDICEVTEWDQLRLDQHDTIDP